MNIIFMGSAGFAVPSLEALINAGYNIVTVMTQPDKPAGRGQKLKSPPVAEKTKELGLPLYQPKGVRGSKVLDKIRALNADCITVVAYGKLLPKELIEMTPFGCINVHASLLPKYRGAAPINWAVVNGDKESGITTMRIAEELDAGDILLVKKVGIEPDDTSITLHDKLAPIGAILLIETIDGLKNGTISETPQDPKLATFAPILTKEDGHINWANSAEKIVNLIRGMQPWPSAFTRLGGNVLKITGARFAKDVAGSKPGMIKIEDGRIFVSTGSGAIELTELQLEGKRKMSAKEFLNGHKIDQLEILE